MFELTEKLAKELSSKLASFDIKEIGEEWSFKVVASDETIDRAGEVIKISGWELWNFMKNPVIIANHVYRVENIIWKANNIYVENDKLIVEWVFATTDLAQDVRKLYDGGFIKTVSVGFIPKERDPNNSNIITRAELLEVSFVPVPCNPNALSLGKEVVEDLIAKGLLIKEEGEEEKKEDEADANDENEINDWQDSSNNEEEAVEEVVEDEDVPLDTQAEDPNQREDEKDISLNDVLEEIKSLRSEIKDFISNNRKADDNAGELDEDKDAKIKMQKEALQNVSKVVSDVLHKIKL